MNKLLIVICVLLGPILGSNSLASEIVLATSTSTKSTGLLEKIIPAFEKSSEKRLVVHSVGRVKHCVWGGRVK